MVVIAALSGGVLYLFRRNFRFIVPAMIAHGLWDFSTFLDVNDGRDLTSILSLLLTIAVAVMSLVVLVTLARHDRGVVTPGAIVEGGAKLAT